MDACTAAAPSEFTHSGRGARSDGRARVLRQLANVEAAAAETKLREADYRAFSEYARATLPSYCGGCGEPCDGAAAPCVSEVIRQLMYFNSYEGRARESFRRLPAAVRDELARADLSAAEARCPHGVPVRARVAEALARLA